MSLYEKAEVVLKNDVVLVIDDLLSPEKFAELWQQYQQQQFTPAITNNWHKVWRLGSGMPMQAPNCSFQSVQDAFNAVVSSHPGYINPGAGSFNLTGYIYPSGCKLAWHNDGGYGGVMTYYVHPVWRASWGGELLLSECDAKNDIQKTICLDHGPQSEILMKTGKGIFIAPKPNRLVVQKPCVWHNMSRVDPDAGENLRCSIVAFRQG